MRRLAWTCGLAAALGCGGGGPAGLRDATEADEQAAAERLKATAAQEALSREPEQKVGQRVRPAKGGAADPNAD